MDPQAQPPFPPHLLLRDTLYLLQGIDGRYVRFAIRPPKQQMAGDGVNGETGRDGAQAIRPEEDVGEVMGIEIVADERMVSIVALP